MSPDPIPELTEENPPPSVDDPTVPLFEEETEAPPTPDERRTEFFGDTEPEPAEFIEPAEEPVETPEPETEITEDEPPVAEVSDAAKPLEPEKEVEPAPAEDYRNAAGVRYRFREGEETKALPENSAIELFYNGEYRDIPADKVPTLLAHGLIYSDKSQQISEQAERMKQYEAYVNDEAQKVAEHLKDLERLSSDPDYRDRFIEETDKLRTPEGQLEISERRRQQSDTQITNFQLMQQRQMVTKGQVEPAVAAAMEGNELVDKGYAGFLLNSLLAELPERSLELGWDGVQWVPKHRPAWNRFQEILRRDLPAAVKAEQTRLEGLLSTKDQELEVAEAEKEAATTKAELARNAAASKVPSTAGLPESRSQPRKRIKTVQAGRKWLQDY
jgi:hypothetical protein